MVLIPSLERSLERGQTAISSNRSQRISIERKDVERTTIVLATRMANVFIKKAVNFRNIILLMVKMVGNKKTPLLIVLHYWLRCKVLL